MFNQIIDIISRDRDRRKIFIVFLVKIFLTALISIKLYKMIYGNFSIISWTDYFAVIDYFINGAALKSFVIFSLTWFLCFFIPSAFLNIVSLKLSTAIYKVFEYIISNPHELEEEVKNNKRLGKYFRNIFLILNSVDVIEISNNNVTPGRSFYKFYDYLIDLETENDSVEKSEFADYFSITIQLILLNFWFDLELIDYNVITWIIFILGFIVISFLLFSAHALLSLVELKHSRILNLMEDIDPSLKENELINVKNSEENSIKSSPKSTSET